jgi:hypothetical protein
MNRTVINVDDDDSNADLLDEDEKIFPICQDRLGKEMELGKIICSCTARFHYRCLVQYTRCDPEYNPFLNDSIKCVTCNGIAARIERIKGIDMMMTIQMQTYWVEMKKYVQFVRTDLVQK